MFYVNLQDSTHLDVLQVTKAGEVFLWTYLEKITYEQTMLMNHGICVYMNKKNKCVFGNLKHHLKRCKESECEFFKRRWGWLNIELEQIYSIGIKNPLLFLGVEGKGDFINILICFIVIYDDTDRAVLVIEH